MSSYTNKNQSVYIFFLLLFTSFSAFIILIALHKTELMQVDSQSYIAFHQSRTIGYPAFLWLIKKITGGYDIIPSIQLSCYAASCGFFLSRLLFLYPRKITFFVSLLALVLLFGNPEISRYHFQIMTESFFLSLLLLTLGTWIEFCKKQTYANLAVLSLLIGLAILIRPSGYANLSLLGLACWILGGKIFRGEWVLPLIAPLVLMIFLGAFTNYKLHGFWATQSFLGHNLIGKVTFVMREGIKTPEPERYEQLYKAVKPIQEFVAQVPTYQIRLLLKSPYYDTTRYQFLPEIFPATQDWNKTWQQMAFSVICNNPLAYCRDVIENYIGLWLYTPILSIQQTSQFKLYYDTISPAPYQTSFPLRIEPFPLWLLVFARLCFGCAFLISLVYLIGPLTPFSSPYVFIGAGGSLLIHSHYLLTACLQAGLPRYAFAMWPAIICIGALFSIQLSRLLFKESP